MEKVARFEVDEEQPCPSISKRVEEAIAAKIRNYELIAPKRTRRGDGPMPDWKVLRQPSKASLLKRAFSQAALV